MKTWTVDEGNALLQRLWDTEQERDQWHVAAASQDLLLGQYRDRCAAYEQLLAESRARCDALTERLQRISDALGKSNDIP